MDLVCPIEADVGEPREVVSALVDEGVAVRRRRLPVGDYVLPGGAIVERKAVRDLHLSILTGRLWRQLGALRNATDRPVLLIEGVTLDIAVLAPRAVRGACLAVAEQGIEVVRSMDAADSACWLALLGRRPFRRRRDRPSYAQRRKPAPIASGEVVLVAVPHISVGVARALLERFGSVAGVAAAPTEELLDVRGVGRARVAELRRALHS
jgi:DNA excision repair protein ERCC-4